MTAGRRARDAGGAGDRLRTHLDRSGLLDPEQPVLVALSGGLDSVALLHLLRFQPGGRPGALRAAHFDHDMRAGSAADARWVAGLCRAWGVELTTARAEPPPRSEAEARSLRYAFLEASAPPGWVIATGHHADDQAETVLFRLARGTGLRGLRGIAPRRGRIVRPLLPFARRELAAYAARNGLRFRDDPSNRHLRFARNRIRHRVLPELERARPGAARALARLAEHARRVERSWGLALDHLADEAVVSSDGAGATLARDALHSYHPHLRARVLRHLLRRYGTTPGRAGTQAALEFISSGHSGGSIDLAGGVRLERDFDRIRIVAGPAGGTGGDVEEALEIPDAAAGAGRAVVGGRVFDVRWGPGGPDPSWWHVALPAPRFPLTVRGWRPGDRMRFGYGAKKLKKLFGEWKWDRGRRARTPVLVDAEGRVLAVVGQARAEGVGADGHGFQVAVRDAGER